MNKVCNLCFNVEQSISSDGTIHSVVDDNSNAFLCSKCTQLCSKFMSKVNWDMSFDEFKEKFKEKFNRCAK